MGLSHSIETMGQFWAPGSGVKFILTSFGKSRFSQQKEMRISLRWKWGTLSTMMISDWFLLLREAKEEISGEDWVPVTIQLAGRGAQSEVCPHGRCCRGDWLAWEAVRWSIHQTFLCWEMYNKAFQAVCACFSLCLYFENIAPLP